MAFPSIRSTATVTSQTGAATSHAVNLPATVAAGDTIFVVVRCPVAGAIGWPDATWQELVDASPDAAVGQTGIAYKKADGTEGGTTITVTHASGKLAGVAWSVQGAADPLLRAPELSTVAVGTTGEPNATTCTPTGGAKDYLWITFFTMEGEQTGITAYPTNYTLGQTGLANTGTGGAVTTNATIAGAGRTNNAASEDAAVWDVTGTLDDSSAYTVAFHPAEPVPAPLDRVTAAGTIPRPAPKKSIGVAALTIALSLLQSTLAPAVESSYVTSQTTHLAAQKQARQYQPPNLLTGSLGEVLPFAQRDWPVPLRKNKTLVIRTSTRPSSDPVPFALNEWPRPQRGRYQDLITTETRLTQDSAVAFNEHDWPLPGRRGHQHQLRTSFQNLLEGTLAPEAPSSFGQFNWPRPQRRSSLYVETGFSALVEPEVIPAPPFTQSEWPRPLRAGYSIVTTETRLTTAPGTPFSQSDWPVPLRKNRTLRITISTRTSTEAEAPAQAPFSQSEWQTPRGKSLQIDQRTWTDRRELGLEDQRLPFGPSAWPVQQGRSAIRRSVEQSLSLALTVPPGTPFTPIAWPVPQRRKPLSVTFYDDYALDDTSPAPRQSDWPLPLRKKYNRDALTFIEYSVVDDNEPLAQKSEVRPQARRSSIQLRTWTQNLLQGTLSIAPGNPFKQAEWPRPLKGGAAYLVTTETRSVVDPEPAAGTPFGQSDWANPQRRTRRSLSTEHAISRALTTPVTVAPFKQTQWELPVRKGLHGGRLNFIEYVVFDQTFPPVHQSTSLPAPRRHQLQLRTWTQNLLQSTLVSGATAQPGAGTLTLTGLAPSLGFTVPVPAGALALTGQTPSLGFTMPVPAGALNLTGLQPTLGLTVPVAAGALTLTGQAPALGFTVPVPAGTLTFIGRAPSVGFGFGIGAGSLTLTGLAPNLIVPVNIAIPVGQLTLSGQAPDAGTGTLVPQGQLTLTGRTPAIAFGFGVPAGQLTLTGYAPVAAINFATPIPAGQLTLAGQAPELAYGLPVGAGSLAFTGLAPTILISVTLAPAAGELSLTGHAPELRINFVIEIPTGSLTLNGTVLFTGAADVPIGFASRAGSLRLIGAAVSSTTSSGAATFVTSVGGRISS